MQFNSKNFNHPTRGNFVVVMALASFDWCSNTCRSSHPKKFRPWAHRCGEWELGSGCRENTAENRVRTCNSFSIPKRLCTLTTRPLPPCCVLSGSRGVPGADVWGRQPVRHPCQASHHHAQGPLAGAQNRRLRLCLMQVCPLWWR